MPLGTLDRTPPPFFKQGPSALSKLMVFSALALFLMVADTRFRLTQPLRAAQQTEAEARVKLAQQSQRANQVEQLSLENARLRKLLELRERLATPGQAAEVLYDAADPYTRKVI